MEERQRIKCSSFSCHRNYGKRMLLSFNKEIQSVYYQNMLVRIKGALLEWVDVAGATNTHYFGHWSGDSKQYAAAMTPNMCCKLCVNGDATKLVQGLRVRSTAYRGMNSAAMLYCCGKSIYGQATLSTKLHIMIDSHVEAPGHGKWWLDGKTGKDNGYCQQCMCCIMTPKTENSGKHMLFAKWRECAGETAAMSPADKCICLLRDPSRVNQIISEGMRAKCEGNALVLRNDYRIYTMVNVLPLPDYKVVLLKGQFNGLHAHYNICTDPDLGMGWAALCCIACSCGPCKDQLEMLWVPGIDVAVQPRYPQNVACVLWPSYEDANNRNIWALVSKTKADKKGAGKSLRCIINALEAHMSLIVREGKVSAAGTTDKAAMGYYLVKWLSKPYSLQEDNEGMFDEQMIFARTVMVDTLYFNWVKRAPLWFTPSGVMMVVEVKYVLRTAMQLQPVRL